MKKPDTILDEIHEIRKQIELRTQGMTEAEITAYFNQRGAAAAKKHGFEHLRLPPAEVSKPE